VNEVLPEAVQTNGTEIIPNIYEQASVSGANSDILIFSNFSTVNLERKTNSNELFKKLGLKIDKSVEANITEIINAHSIKIDVSMSDYSSNGIFVFGQEVNNFMNLQKSYLWTVATAALQEVDRQLQSEKITVQSHDAMIQTIQQEINSNVNTDDPRTQTNCADADTSSALDTLRLLKPKTFEYTDTINNTEQTVYGFDSNQIKQVVPYAAQTTKIQKIPNMYQKASVLGKKIIFTSFNVVNLAKDASNHLYPRIVILDANDKEHEVKIVQLVNSYTIETDVELQSFVREDSSVSNCVFVYGQIVENFETLSKDYIWTISTAALQEVDKQVQDEKNKQIELSNKVDMLMNSSQVQVNSTSSNVNVNVNEELLQNTQTLLENKIILTQSELENKINQNQSELENKFTQMSTELTLEKIKRLELETNFTNEINKNQALETKIDTLETKLEQYIEIMNSLLTNME